MARSERLLELIQVLRRHRWPVSGQTLADELGVSLRTIYRDVETLNGLGASIEGEAGIGFVLRPGFADRKGERTRRTVWPIALGYFEHVRVLAAWCELREDFRNFRTDRILALQQTETRYPRRRRALMKAWQEIEGIPPQ